MAQHVQIKLIDDIDGSDAVETVSFGLDGIVYEIDLSGKSAAQLRENLASWVGSARRAKSRTARPARTKVEREDLNKMRDWGRANGFSVSERGRVSRVVQEAYAAAH